MTGMSVVSFYHLVASVRGMLNDRKWFTNDFSDSQNGLRICFCTFKERQSQIYHKLARHVSKASLCFSTAQIGVRTQLFSSVPQLAIYCMLTSFYAHKYELRADGASHNHRSYYIQLCWQMCMLATAVKNNHQTFCLDRRNQVTCLPLWPLLIKSSFNNR